MERVTSVKVRPVVKLKMAADRPSPITAATSWPLPSMAKFQMPTSALRIPSSQLSARLPKRRHTIRPLQTTLTVLTVRKRAQKRRKLRFIRSSSSAALLNHINRYHSKGSQRHRKSSANARMRESRRFYLSTCLSFLMAWVKSLRVRPVPNLTRSLFAKGSSTER